MKLNSKFGWNAPPIYLHALRMSSQPQAFHLRNNTDATVRSHNPLSEVAGKTKFVPADAQAVRAARSMGISLGD